MYELFQNSESLMIIEAKDRQEAWRIIRKAGIRNQSKTLQLIETE